MGKKIVPASEIVEMVRELHYRPEDFDDGDIVDRIYGHDFYELVEELPIRLVEEPIYYIDWDLVEEYIGLDAAKMPPVILGKVFGGVYEIIDGCHRIMAAAKKKDKVIRAFIPYVKRKAKEECQSSYSYAANAISGI